MLQRTKGTETQLICKHFKLIPLTKDASRYKPSCSDSRRADGCLSSLSQLASPANLSTTQALSRISQFFTIPGNTKHHIHQSKRFCHWHSVYFPSFPSVGQYVPLISAFFRYITQRIVVIPTRRFGTTYRSHLQRSRNLSLYIILGYYDP
jgi:hypothetical protein